MDKKDYATAFEPIVQAANNLIPEQNLVELGQAAADAFARANTVEIGKFANSMSVALDELAKSMSNSIPRVEIAQSIIESLAKTACSSLPDSMVSVEEARALMKEVKPYLPPDTTVRIETKIEEFKTTDNKLSTEMWLSILSMLLSIILFGLGQVLPNAQLDKIIDLLSQRTEVFENSDNVPEAFDDRIFEISSPDQMFQESQSKQDTGNIRNQLMPL